MGLDVRVYDKLREIKNQTTKLIDKTEKLCEGADELLNEMECSDVDTSDFTLRSASMYVKSSLMEAKRLIKELDELQGTKPLQKIYQFKSLVGAFNSEPEDAITYYTLEPKDTVIGNVISSPYLGNWTISKILSKDFFEATQGGELKREFMIDGRSHWNDSIPTVFKCTYFQQQLKGH